MISWIQVTFQKHTKLIFLFLLLVIAIPFVFTIGATPGIGKAGHKILEKPFFGYNLASADDQRRIFGDAELSVYLRAGYMALDGSQLQDYALQRAAALHLADTYGLPAPSPKQLTDHLAGLRVFQNAEGQFDAKRYADFIDSLNSNPRLTRAEVARVMNDDVRATQIQEILSGPGYVLPPEVKSQVERAGTEWTVSVASTDFAAFTPQIVINELSLGAFFDQNIARYQTPPRVSVDYVTFKPSAYVNDVKFTEDDLLAFYKANPARFPVPTDDAKAGADAAPPTDAIPPALHAAVESALRTSLASKHAASVASDFDFAIFDQKIERASTGLDELISRYKVTRQKAPLFTASAPPKELGWTDTIAKEAFKLNEQRYFSDPLPLADGSVVVLFWNETVPETTPALADVRDAVVRDFTNVERRRMFVEAGAKWRAALQAKISSGMTLEAAAASLASPKFEVVNYGPFTRRKPPEKIEPTVLAALDQTPVGQLSGFTTSGQKGLLVDVVAKKELAVDDSSPEFAAARDQLARISANVSQTLILSELVKSELDKTSDLDR